MPSADLGQLVSAVAAALGGYLIGSLPLAVAIGRAVGVDILTEGEGNPGSANVWKLAGPRAGMVALAGDLGKGFAPGFVARVVAGWSIGWVAALTAIIGHG